jgi:ribulose-phosphate 3-epimerase
MIEKVKPGYELEVDGGIDETTPPLVVDAGANVLVAGSAIFSAEESITAAMQRIRRAVSKNEDIKH